MDWRALGRMDAFSAVLVGVKLLLLPAATLGVCLLLGTDPGLAQVLTMFAALPTASAAHVLASAFGADRMRAATVVAQSTLLSALTLPLWISLVEFLT